MDTRWVNIVSLMELHLTGASTVREGILHVIGDRPTGARHRVRAFGQMLFLSTLGNQQLLAWQPPLLLDAEEIIFQNPNVDTAIANCSTNIYCFQKRVLEKVPLNIILASLPSVQYLNVNTG